MAVWHLQTVVFCLHNIWVNCCCSSLNYLFTYSSIFSCRRGSGRREFQGPSQVHGHLHRPVLPATEDRGPAAQPPVCRLVTHPRRCAWWWLCCWQGGGCAAICVERSSGESTHPRGAPLLPLRDFPHLTCCFLSIRKFAIHWQVQADSMSWLSLSGEF